MVRTWMVTVSAALLLASAVTACNQCELLEDDAADLVRRYEACADGDSCQVVNLYDMAGPNNCLGAFQCAAALRVGSDLEAFRDEAQSLTHEYRGCGKCVAAGCADPSTFTATCDVATGRCELSQSL